MDNLLSAKAVRSRCLKVAELVEEGNGNWFEIDQGKFGGCVDRVLRTCYRNYPDLAIPLHSRWRHFELAGGNLWQHYTKGFQGSQRDLAKSAIDLVFVSVILDAGAGESWRYQDLVTGTTLSRSEGLAAASVDLFFNHLAQSNSDSGWWLEADSLAGLDEDTFCRVYQVSDDNSLIGIQGRVDLIHRLGGVLTGETIRRPGDLVDVFLDASEPVRGDQVLTASTILETVLDYFNTIWPNAMVRNDEVLGDCGRHSALGKKDSDQQIVPFHKLSQWLSYSLVEPLQWAGLKIIDLDGLTGLPEYRNGGLLIDMGVLVFKDKSLMGRVLSMDAEAVVEWRALTVVMLDRIADAVRKQTCMESDRLPLSAVLQGGTWAAGREIALNLRPDGSPPLKLDINGTVF